jgi:ABC-type lipoprotein export system ATPase subunit
MEILRAENLWRRFEGRDVLKGLSLSVERGDMVLIQGPSGVGKTTLLNILAGLDIPDRGEVYIEGEPIFTMDEDGRARLRLNKIGMVFQDMNLIDDLTVYENIALPLKLARRKWKRRVEYLLDYFGIKDIARKKPYLLSGGERQRVAIARAMANDPPLILADEPTSNLDAENAERVAGMFVRLNESMGTTVVIVSHDPRIGHIGRRRYVLNDGRLEPLEE